MIERPPQVEEDSRRIVRTTLLGLFFRGEIEKELPWIERLWESRANWIDERKYSKLSSAWPPLSLNVTITHCRHVRFDGQNNWTRSRRSHSQSVVIHNGCLSFSHLDGILIFFSRITRDLPSASSGSSLVRRANLSIGDVTSSVADLNDRKWRPGTVFRRSGDWKIRRLL